MIVQALMYEIPISSSMVEEIVARIGPLIGDGISVGVEIVINQGTGY